MKILKFLGILLIVLIIMMVIKFVAVIIFFSAMLFNYFVIAVILSFGIYALLTQKDKE